MADTVRIIAIGGTAAALLVGLIAAPQVFAAVTAIPEKAVGSATIDDLFPPPFDPKTLRKFDFTFDPTVSKEITSTRLVKKIGYGNATVVTIVTTPNRTYSSDAIASPYVRYPGIEVTPHHDESDWSQTSLDLPAGKVRWTSRTEGSFTYLTLTVVDEART